MNPNTESQVRSALIGHHILVVGGERREDARLRLQTRLGLLEVVHCPTRAQDASPRAFLPQIHDPSLLLVVCLLGVSRTHHSKQVHALCRDLELPFVDCARMPHPNQLVANLVRLRLGTALLKRAARIGWLGGAA
jgi:hypothetical protein